MKSKCGRISPEKGLGNLFQSCAERLSRSGKTVFSSEIFSVEIGKCRRETRIMFWKGVGFRLKLKFERA